MKLKSLLIAPLFLSASAFAQITIQGSSLNGWAPADTMKDLTNANVAIAANGTWDLSTATYSTNYFTTTDEAATHPSFPGAAFRDHVSYGLSPYLSYLSARHWGKNNNGVYIYGEQIERQGSSLESITTNPLDSLVFPEQTVAYSTPEKMMAFPMSFGSSWSNTVRLRVNFDLTVNMFGMVNMPGERRTVLELRDSVKGWGKMRVNDINGQPSAYIDVLVVQETEHTTDSFYLAGSPAPEQLLASFGMAQGQADARFTTLFFRSGEVKPLLRLEHTDSTFTTTTGAVAMVSRLTAPVTGIGDVKEAHLFNLYPNPVTNGTLYINGLAPGSKWTYTLTSINGQAWSKGALAAGNASLNVAGAAAGVYTLDVLKDGISQGAQFIIIP